MAAGSFVIHDKAKKYAGTGTGGIDFDGDTFKIVLCDNTSNAATTSVDGYAALTGELATANGYTNGGYTLTSVTWTESGGTVTFDAADPSWTASGGSITARYAVVYDNTVAAPVAKPIVAHVLLDTTPADVTTTSGNTLVVQLAATGILQVV